MHPYLASHCRWGKEKESEESALLSPPKSHLARQIHDVMDRAGITLRELSRSLSQELSQGVGLSTLWGWAQDADPKIVSTQEIERALERVLERWGELPIRGVWMDQRVIQEHFQFWTDQIDSRSFADCLNLDPGSLSAYLAGERTMRTRRFLFMREYMGYLGCEHPALRNPNPPRIGRSQ